jgi:hypothetical protein
MCIGLIHSGPGMWYMSRQNSSMEPVYIRLVKGYKSHFLGRHRVFQQCKKLFSLHVPDAYIYIYIYIYAPRVHLTSVADRALFSMRTQTIVDNITVCIVWVTLYTPHVHEDHTSLVFGLNSTDVALQRMHRKQMCISIAYIYNSIIMQDNASFKPARSSFTVFASGLQIVTYEAAYKLTRVFAGLHAQTPWQKPRMYRSLYIGLYIYALQE